MILNKHIVLGFRNVMELRFLLGLFLKNQIGLYLLKPHQKYYFRVSFCRYHLDNLIIQLNGKFVLKDLGEVDYLQGRIYWRHMGSLLNIL